MNKPEHEKEPNSLLEFTSALSHTIRTPLATVCNNLTYYKHKIEDEEILSLLDQDIAKCQQISSVLTNLSNLGEELRRLDTTEPTTVQAILREVHDAFPVSVSFETEPSVELVVNKRALVLGVGALLMALSNRTRSNTPEFKVDVNQSSAIINVEFQVDINPPSSEFSSLAQYGYREIHDLNPAYSVLDALVEDLRGEISVCPGSECTLVTLRFSGQ